YPETLQYDALGRLVVDTNPIDSYTYGYADATPRLSARTSQATGQRLFMSYFPPAQDALLKNITYATPGGTLAQFNYQFDANHNVTSAVAMFGPPNGVNNHYDQYGQLLFSGTSSAPEQYNYDLAGNIMGFNPSPAAARYTTVTYSGVNEVPALNTPNGPVGLQFDPSGNTTAFGSVRYTYDGYGRLISAGNGSGTGSLFAYDAMGRMVQVVDQSAGFTTANHFYEWCGSRRCAAYDATQSNSNGIPPMSNMYATQGMYGKFGPQSTVGNYQYIPDALGSIRGVVNGTSPNPTVEAQVNYDAFGNATNIVSSPIPADFGYAGYFQHGGLNLTENRAYLPSTGKWLTRDPVGFAVASTGLGRFAGDRINLGAYVGNNPTSRVDPSGLSPIPIEPEELELLLEEAPDLPEELAQAAPEILEGWGQALSNIANWLEASGVPAPVECAAPDVMVIGRLGDTGPLVGKPGLDVLNLVGSSWSPEANAAWIQSGIDAGRTFYLASPITEANLLESQNVSGFAIYADEITQILGSGYRWEGEYLIPP
ncbi:MAG: RHS repeat domain-containing protein, partial [Polyangiaceae bacterium]